MIHELSQWLAASQASQAIQSHFWVVPVVQTVHLLAISAVVASAALLGSRLLGWAGLSQSLAATAQRWVPWIWRAVLVLLISGSLLIIGEPARTLGNPSFWAKLVSLGLALTLMQVLQSGLRRDPQGWGASSGEASSRSAKLLGGSLLLLWVAVVVFGRWIAYVLEV